MSRDPRTARRNGRSSRVADRGRAVAAIVLLACAPATGCGKKGPPLAPAPRGPLAATDVRARQIGDEVVVSFLVPEPRGAEPGQVPARAEIVRVAYPPGVPARTDPDAFRRRGELVAVVEAGIAPGSEVRIVDPHRDGRVEGGAGATLRYGVRLRDRRGRPSPLVAAEDLVPAPVPAPAGALVAEPVAEGVRLAWEPPAGPGPFRYNVYRRRPGEGAPFAPVHPRPLESPSYLDTDVVSGTAYEYFVRVAAGDGEPFRESVGTEPVEVVAEDRFAPSTPEGLVGVQEAASVRLFWNPAPERDVVGYRVYRRPAGTDGRWERIGTDPVREPLVRDEDVAVGETWAYRVTAVDRADPPNESPPSSAVVVELLSEPGFGPAGEGG